MCQEIPASSASENVNADWWGEGAGHASLNIVFFCFPEWEVLQKMEGSKTSFHKISYKLRKIGGSIFSMIMILLNGLRDVLLMV